MLVIQGNHTKSGSSASKRAESESRLGALGAARQTDGCTYPVNVATDYGAGISYELEDGSRRRSFDREALKLTQTEKDGKYIVATSRIKRTMADSNLLASMGLGQDNTDPNMPPPTDSQLIMGHFGKVLAKQRWGKATSALSALRAMKLGNSLGKAKETAPEPEKPAEPEKGARAVRSSLKRMSITSLAGDTAESSAVATMKMSKLPNTSDVQEFLRALKGNFAFCILDTQHDFLIAARSENAEAVKFFYGVMSDGAICFSNDKAGFPEGVSDVKEVPPHSFFIGRADEAPQFKSFAPEPPVEP